MAFQGICLQDILKVSYYFDPHNAQKVSLADLNDLAFSKKEQIRIEFNQNYKGFSDPRAKYKNNAIVPESLMDKLVHSLFIKKDSQAY